MPDTALDTLALRSRDPSQHDDLKGRLEHVLELANGNAVFTRIVDGAVLVTALPGVIDKIKADYAAAEPNVRLTRYAGVDTLRLGPWKVSHTGTSTLIETDSLPEALVEGASERFRATEASCTEWLVQFVAPPRPIWLAELREAGVEVRFIVSRTAVAIRAPLARVEELRASSPTPVLWVAPHHPLFKVHPRLLKLAFTGRHDPRLENVQIAVDPGRLAAVLQGVRALGGRVSGDAPEPVFGLFIPRPHLLPASPTQPAAGRFVCDLPFSRLEAVAALPGVRSLQLVPRFPAAEGEVEALIVAGIPFHPDAPPSTRYGTWLERLGLSGAGTTLAICDTGVDRGTGNNSAGRLDLRGRLTAVIDYTGGAQPQDPTGHGTLVAGLALGAGLTDSLEIVVDKAYELGLGVAPEARYAALTAIPPTPDEQASLPASLPWWPPAHLGRYAHDARDHGAEVLNTSWTLDKASPGKGYTDFCGQVDDLVRDPTGSHLPQAGLIWVMSAGNATLTNTPTTLTEPKEAKNAIIVGMSLGPRTLVEWGSAEASPDRVHPLSAQGPTLDGRFGVDIVAPGADVLGIGPSTPPEAGVKTGLRTLESDPLPQGTSRTVYRLPGGTARTAVASFVGNVSGAPAAPANGSFVAGTGTSFAASLVSGAALLVVEWWRRHTGETPSPALVKALLINGAEEMLPDEIGGDAGLIPSRIPSPVQGWGRVNLSNIFLQRDPGQGAQRPGAQRGPRVHIPLPPFDDHDPAGAVRSFDVVAELSNAPVRVTLVWTDPPGAPQSTPALMNDLDLEVIGAHPDVAAPPMTWLGNQFQGGLSRVGGTNDALNTVECVYIPANQRHGDHWPTYTVQVHATDILADARPPYQPGRRWQDFALVVENARLVPAQADRRRIRMLIDRSSSVAVLDPGDHAATAALGQLAHLRPMDEIGVTRFPTDSPTSTQRVTTTATIQVLLSDLRTTAQPPSGDTPLAAALAQALEEARHTTGTPPGPVLVWTDGWYTGVRPVWPAFSPVPLVICALLPSVNGRFLSTLTGDRGLLAYAAVERDVGLAANTGRAFVLGDQLIVNEVVGLPGGQRVTSTVGGWVEPGLSLLTISVGWDRDGVGLGSSLDDEPLEQLRVQLRGPRGQQVPFNSSLFRRFVDGRQVTFELPSPPTGRWVVELTSLPDVDLVATVAMSVRGGAAASLKVSRPRQDAPRRAVVTVQFSGVTPAYELRAEGRVERPFAVAALTAEHQSPFGSIQWPPPIAFTALGDGQPEESAALREGRNVLLAQSTPFDPFEPMQEALTFTEEADATGTLTTTYDHVDVPGLYTFVVDVWAWAGGGEPRLQRTLRRTVWLEPLGELGAPAVVEAETAPEAPVGPDPAFDPSEQINADELGVIIPPPGGPRTPDVRGASSLRVASSASPSVELGSITVLGSSNSLWHLTVGDGLSAVDPVTVAGFTPGREYWRLETTGAPLFDQWTNLAAKAPLRFTASDELQPRDAFPYEEHGIVTFPITGTPAAASFTEGILFRISALLTTGTTRTIGYLHISSVTVNNIPRLLQRWAALPSELTEIRNGTQVLGRLLKFPADGVWELSKVNLPFITEPVLAMDVLQL